MTREGKFSLQSEEYSEGYEAVQEFDPSRHVFQLYFDTTVIIMTITISFASRRRRRRRRRVCTKKMLHLRVNHFSDRMMMRSDWRPTSSCIFFSVLNFIARFKMSVLFMYVPLYMFLLSPHGAVIFSQERKGGMKVIIILIHSLSNLMISNSKKKKKKRPQNNNNSNNNNNMELNRSSEEGLGQSPLNCFQWTFSSSNVHDLPFHSVMSS